MKKKQGWKNSGVVAENKLNYFVMKHSGIKNQCIWRKRAKEKVSWICRSVTVFADWIAFVEL